MPGDPNFDWLDGPAKPPAAPSGVQPTAPPPAAKRVSAPAPAASSGFDWLDGDAQQAATAVPAAGKPAGSLLTTSIAKTVTGKGMSDLFEGSALQKTLNAIIPESVHGSTQDWTSKFMAEVYRAAPEMLDTLTSPMGIGLIAAHMIPQTRGIAAAADYALSAMQGVDLMHSLGDWSKDPSDPQKAAHAAIGIFNTYGLLKAGSKTAGARSGSAPPAFRDSAALVDDMSTLGSQVEKVAALDKAAATTPKTGKIPASDKVANFLTSSPYFREIAKVINIPKSDLLQTMSDLVVDRGAAIAVPKLPVNATLDWISRNVPEEELRIYNLDEAGKVQPANKIAAVVQGTKTADEVNLSPAGRQAVQAIKDMNVRRADLLEKFYGNDIKLLEDKEGYLAQIWDFKDKNSPGDVGKVTMRDRFVTNKRVLDDYAQGIELGFKPRYNDITDLVRIREDHAITTIANQRLANTFRDIGGIISEDDANKLGLKDKWVRLDDVNALDKAVYVGSEVKKIFVGGEPVTRVTDSMRFRPVYAHPDVAQAVRAVWGKGFQGQAFKSIDALRATGKKIALSGSFFHNIALMEQSEAVHFAHDGAVDLKKLKDFYEPAAFKSVERDFPGGSFADRKLAQAGRVVKHGIFATNPEYIAGIKRGLFDVLDRKEQGEAPPILRLDNRGIAEDGLRHGLQVSSLDAEAKVTSILRNAGKDSPVSAVKLATAPLRMLGAMSHIMDRSLWDFYHQGEMLYSYETISAHELSKLPNSASPSEVAAMKRAVANHVNNVYGAINYENLLLHPKTRQLLNFALLAPAWTISNSRVWTQSFEGTTSRKLSAKYAVGAFVPWFLSTQVANYALSKWFDMPDKNGKKGGHFSFDNPGVPLKFFGHDTGVTHNWSNIVDGYNANKSERYIVLGKGFREGFNWVTDPYKTFLSKRSLPLTAAWLLANQGVDPATGYQAVDPHGSDTDKWIQRADIVMQAFVPFGASNTVKELKHDAFPELFSVPVSGGQEMLSLPTKQGISRMTAVDLYTRAVEEGDNAQAMAVLDYASKNGLDTKSIRSAYSSWKRSREKRAAGPGSTVDRFGNSQE